MDGQGPQTTNHQTWDVRAARQRKRLPEAEYRAALARGEIEKSDATKDVIRGDALIDQVKSESGDQCLCAFSTGKDSIAAYLAIRAKFKRVVPYYMFAIPDLEFVEESLRYYEMHLTEEPIIRMPHPSLYARLNNLVFQSPDRVMLLRAANLGGYDHDYMRELIIEEAGLPAGAMAATGVRANDNTIRRMAVATYGPINRQQHVFWPIWDWRKAEVIDAIKAEGLHLPVDYDLFGRTWDGLSAHYLIPIKKHFPRDYQKILEWFPLADVELFRLERYGDQYRDVWHLESKGRELRPKGHLKTRARREAEARRLSSLAALPAGDGPDSGPGGHGLGAGEREAGAASDPEPLQEKRRA
jgi:hypothetical protein